MVAPTAIETVSRSPGQSDLVLNSRFYTDQEASNPRHVRHGTLGCDQCVIKTLYNLQPEIGHELENSRGAPA